MDEQELAGVRAQLEDFAATVFAGLVRSDQRATGLRYLRGLMLDGRRKSMQPMAERLGVDHQQLQQFLTSSTWDVTGVRRRLAAAAVEVIEPTVWVVDDTGFPKDGKASPGVARQYSGTLGKVANCLIAVSVHAATDAASAVLDWRLFVPDSWDETCVPDEHGNITNPHAHRLRQSPHTCRPSFSVPMTASFRVPIWVVCKGPAVVFGGAFGRRGDGFVGRVTPVAAGGVQSVVTSVTAARAAFSSTMALPPA